MKTVNTGLNGSQAKLGVLDTVLNESEAILTQLSDLSPNLCLGSLS